MGHNITLATWFLLGMSILGCGGPRPASKAQLVASAEAALQREDYQAAGDAYYRAASLDPADAQLVARAARAYVGAFNFADAADPARRAADMLPDDLDVQLLAARVLLRQREFTEIESRASKLLQAHPGNTDLRILWATARARIPGTDRALVWLARAHPSEVLSDMVTSMRDQPRPADDAAAEEEFRMAVQARPEAFSPRAALVNFLLAVGRFDEAEMELRRMIEAYPDRLMLHAALGGYYVRRQRFGEAEPHLQRAIAEDGDRGTAASLSLADIYALTGRPAEAMAVLLARTRDQQDPDVVLRLASLELGHGDPQSGLARLDALIARRTVAPEAAALKARALIAIRPADAVRAAHEAVAAAPTSADAHQVLGEVLEATGDLESAFDAYSDAVDRQPSVGSRLVALVQLALVLRRGEEFITQAGDAARLNPGSEDAAVLPARVFTSVRDYGSAEGELRRIERTGSPSVPWLLAVAELRTAQGRHPEARSAFEAALKLAPERMEAVAGLADLEVAGRQAVAAIQRLQAASMRSANDPRLLAAAVRAYESSGDTVRADLTLLSLLDQRPADLASVMPLVTPAFLRRNQTAAKRSLERIAEARPRAAAARLVLADHYERSGDTARAVATYEAILRLPTSKGDEATTSRAVEALSALRDAPSRRTGALGARQ